MVSKLFESSRFSAQSNGRQDTFVREGPTLPLLAMESSTSRRERNARILGVAVALAFMAAAAFLIRWPAPGVAGLLGFAVYLVARRRGDEPG